MAPLHRGLQGGGRPTRRVLPSEAPGEEERGRAAEHGRGPEREPGRREIGGASRARPVKFVFVLCFFRGAVGR